MFGSDLILFDRGSGVPIGPLRVPAPFRAGTGGNPLEYSGQKDTPDLAAPIWRPGRN
jgi:hypothetical protein